ncbi:MAG: helix-turn-helix transcriptional regulator [Methylicorpusculum sp.]|uniref:helix-turn-helix domain-containing protein n=1 Tax=Methylicorpusculum sp. TaxID=2713644 RepID=UPI00271C7F07|nr:helix-turn-helix transcriptional regulator [Methylicorpusculum sp.]MDO8941510.1 helix-turn-helix transcriptional regulator [Methylicorpusculum sp.]
MSTVQGKRLTEERERLRLSLQSLGDMYAIDADTQQQFETGKRVPSPDYWHAISQFGVDVAYVLAGVRTANVATTPREVALLYNYRMQSADTQSALSLLAAQFPGPVDEAQRQKDIDAFNEKIQLMVRMYGRARVLYLLFGASESLTKLQAEQRHV